MDALKRGVSGLLSGSQKRIEYHLETDAANTKIPPELLVPFPEKWSELVVPTLSGLTKKTPTLDDFIDLGPLREFFEKELRGEAGATLLTRTIPALAALALELPTLLPNGLPQLAHQKPAALWLSKRQVAALLAHGFFCTWPRRKGQQYNAVNWAGLYRHLDSPAECAKLKMLLSYVTRITELPAGPSHKATLGFYRRGIVRLPPFSSCTNTTFPRAVVSHTGTIEDATGTLQMDFAHRLVGGGVLSGGCVQEEIRFAMQPELLAACVFTELLDDNEAMLITGAERFSSYTGYGASLAFAADFHDGTPRDASGSLLSTLVCIDAMDFRTQTKQRDAQFAQLFIDRELQKCVCGWAPLDDEPGGMPGGSAPVRAVATGQWGCGAALGDREHKAVLQLIAAAYCGRPLHYFTFGDEQFAKQLQDLADLLHMSGANVAQVYKLLLKYDSKRKKQPSFFAFMRTQFKLKI